MKTLDIFIPDFKKHLEALSMTTPFEFWPVVDRTVIEHWIDYAINHRYQEIKLYCRHNCDAILDKIGAPEAWPISVSVEAHYTIIKSSAMRRIWELFDMCLDTAPKNEACLIKCHHNLEKKRFEILETENRNNRLQHISRNTKIHSSVILKTPFWIGGHCSIGKNASIGPYAIIGNDCNIGSHSELSNSTVFDKVNIGSETHFKNHLIDGNMIYSRSRNLVHTPVEKKIVALRK